MERGRALYWWVHRYRAEERPGPCQARTGWSLGGQLPSLRGLSLPVLPGSARLPGGGGAERRPVGGGGGPGAPQHPPPSSSGEGEAGAGRQEGEWGVGGSHLGPRGRGWAAAREPLGGRRAHLAPRGFQLPGRLFRAVYPPAARVGIVSRVRGALLWGRLSRGGLLSSVWGRSPRTGGPGSSLFWTAAPCTPSPQRRPCLLGHQAAAPGPGSLGHHLWRGPAAAANQGPGSRGGGGSGTGFRKPGLRRGGRRVGGTLRQDDPGDAQGPGAQGRLGEKKDAGEYDPCNQTTGPGKGIEPSSFLPQRGKLRQGGA